MPPSFYTNNVTRVKSHPGDKKRDQEKELHVELYRKQMLFI